MQNNFDLINFKWAVAPQYELVSPKGLAASKLIPAKVVSQGDKLKAYNPRKVLGLHRIFANLPEDSESIFQFISQYGFIGVEGIPVNQIRSEEVDLILKYQKELKEVLNYIDSTFKLVRKWEKERRELLDEGKSIPQLSKKPIAIAARLINQWAEKYIQQIEVFLETPVWANPNDVKGEPPVLLKLRPKTLLALFWFSAIEELYGNSYINCKVCGKPIYVGEGGARKDKETCSISCRKKFSRDS